jgi:hypothetical protein
MGSREESRRSFMTYARTITMAFLGSLVSWTIAAGTATASAPTERSKDGRGAPSPDRDSDSASGEDGTATATVSEDANAKNRVLSGLLLIAQAGATLVSSRDIEIPTQGTVLVGVGLPFEFSSWVLEPRVHVQVAPLILEPGGARSVNTREGVLSSAIGGARFGYAFEKIGIYAEGGGGVALVAGFSGTAVVGVLRVALDMELPITRNLSVIVTPALSAIAASDKLTSVVGAMQRIDALAGASYLF